MSVKCLYKDTSFIKQLLHCTKVAQIRDIATQVVSDAEHLQLIDISCHNVLRGIAIISKKGANDNCQFILSYSVK
jgi:hypothetical protein